MGDVVSFVKDVVSSPFTFIRETGRAVDSLAQGDLKGTLRHGINATGAGMTAATGGLAGGMMGEGGYLVDTTVEKAKSPAAPVEEEAAVSFTTGTDPSVTVGADESEDFLKKKTTSTASKGNSSFLGGVGNTGSLVL